MMRAVVLASLLAASFAAAGCFEEAAPPGGEPTPGTGEPPGGDVEDVAMRTLAQGTHSGFEGSLRRVFDNEPAWTLFWEEHASKESPPPARPAVDFATERVVAVSLGNKPNLCWSVGITNVTRSQEADGTPMVLVEVTTYTPPEGMMCASAISQPHHYVAITSAETDVRFTEHEATGPPPEADA